MQSAGDFRGSVSRSYNQWESSMSGPIVKAVTSTIELGELIGQCLDDTWRVELGAHPELQFAHYGNDVFHSNDDTGEDDEQSID